MGAFAVASRISLRRLFESQRKCSLSCAKVGILGNLFGYLIVVDSEKSACLLGQADLFKQTRLGRPRWMD